MFEWQRFGVASKNGGVDIEGIPSRISGNIASETAHGEIQPYLLTISIDLAHQKKIQKNAHFLLSQTIFWVFPVSNQQGPVVTGDGEVK